MEHSSSGSILMSSLILPQTDTLNTFPLFLILLRPTRYIFLTASIYMTVTLAVNRCLEMGKLRRKMPPYLKSFHDSGKAQSITIFLLMVILNLPQWFEYRIVDADNSMNITKTSLKKDSNYNLYYKGIFIPIYFLVLPFVIMVIATTLMLRQLRAVTTRLSIPELQRKQEKRNKSMSITLIGIIAFFMFSQSGNIVRKCYSVWGGDVVYKEDWVKYLDVINNILAVANCSLNFAIYCKDMLFRRSARKILFNFLTCSKRSSDGNSTEYRTYGLSETLALQNTSTR